MATKKQVNLSVKRGEKLPVSQGAGLTAKGRAKYNRATGSNLKAPAPNPKTEAEETKGRNVISATTYDYRFYASGIRMSIPYVKFSLLGFTQWGDLNDDKVSEWRFFGIKI